MIRGPSMAMTPLNLDLVRQSKDRQRLIKEMLMPGNFMSSIPMP